MYFKPKISHRPHKFHNENYSCMKQPVDWFYFLYYLLLVNDFVDIAYYERGTLFN